MFKSRRRLLILSFSLLYCCGFSAAQSYNFRHYQVEDGLVNNTVFSVFQDQRGFIWLGTKGGITRFDGINFKNFDIRLENGQVINEFVYSIAEGSLGNLFVGTRKGLFACDPVSGLFSLIKPSQEREVFSVLSDNGGKLWYNAEGQLWCYDEHTERARMVALGRDTGIRIGGVCLDSWSRLWVVSENGEVYQKEKARDGFISVCSEASGKRPALPHVTKVMAVNKDSLLVGTTRGLYVFDINKKNYQSGLAGVERLQKVFVRDILAVEQGWYWIGTESGLYLLNPTTGSCINLKSDRHNPYALSDNAVYALLKDREGGIWCGTYFGGVNYFHQQHNFFKNYFGSGDQVLGVSAVREICPASEDKIWIGTENAGLALLDVATGNVSLFQAPEDLPSNNIHALLMDSGQLWIGTFHEGLDVWDLRSKKRVDHFGGAADRRGLPADFVISAVKTRAGQLMFGTSQGIFIFDRDRHRFTRAPGFPASMYVLSLCQDQAGTIWAGTVDGLYYFNPDSGKRGVYQYARSDTNGLSSNYISGVFEDSRQNLWISTEGGGLCQLDQSRSVMTRFNTDNGLPSNMVYKVLEDQSGRIWISTASGLCLWDPKDRSLITFTKEDGLMTDQFNYSSGCRLPDGTLYFGSISGLISFQPDSLLLYKAAPEVHITDLWVNNQLYVANTDGEEASTFGFDSIELKYTESSLALNVAGLSYITPRKIRYAYKMEGVDNDWTYLNTNRRIFYNSLVPGSYIFRVKAAPAFGQWGVDETRLHIVITPPWWKSTVACLIYALAALALIFYLVRFYLRLQKRRSRQRAEKLERALEKEVYQSKIEFFTNIAHEIRTPLTLIKAPLEMALDALVGQEAIRRSLLKVEKSTERLIDLTDQLLDFRRTENQDYRLNFVQLEVVKFVTEMFFLFEPIGRTPALSYQVIKPEQEFIAYVDIEAFKKIIGNLLSNAVKYSEKFIRVEIDAPAGGDFEIRFINDGDKIPFALKDKIFEPFFRLQSSRANGSGIGLALAKSLAELHNGVLVLTEDNASKHNTFVLRLPVHQKRSFILNHLDNNNE